MNLLNNTSLQGKITQNTAPSIKPSNSTKTSIFYVNDIHGQIPKMQRLMSAGIQAEVDAKKNGSDILKLCSGDTFIGGDDKRNIAAASFLNLAGIQAETLGNHEFDMTASICGKILKDSKTKILGMNLNFPDKNSDLSQKVARSTVVEGQNGQKYGVIGLQPTDLTSRIKNKETALSGITVDDDEQTLKELQAEVDTLKQQGLDKIILLSHTGNKFEKQIAQKVSGIDVILGGHSHDLIKGIKEGENLFYSPSGEPVVITQAGRDGNNYGVLNLEFNDKGQISSVQNNVIETNSCSSNLIMSKTVDSIMGKSPEVGKLSYVDPLPGNIMEENPWGDFVADALKKNLDAEIVLVNSGNFRGSVDVGTVTERDITSIFPFQNTLAKVKLNEKDLVDAIKLCGKTLSAENHKPGILQVSGLEYTMDKQGNVLSMSYINKDNQKTAIDVNNPDPNKEYVAVYDEFLLSGGDKLEMLKRDESQILERYDFDKDKVTNDYIRTLSQPFEVRKDGRIKIV